MKPHMEEKEVILGRIPVVARLALGSEKLSLFVTGTRIIVAHVGKRGAGALASISFFGLLGGLVEGLFKGGKESLERRMTNPRTPEQVLAANKDNFSVGFEDIVKITLTETPYTLTMLLLTKTDKFEFSTGTRLVRILELFEQIQEKVETRGFSGDSLSGPMP